MSRDLWFSPVWQAWDDHRMACQVCNASLRKRYQGATVGQMMKDCCDVGRPLYAAFVEAEMADPEPPTPLDLENIHAVLHRLWSKAVGASEYDKEEWKTLERLILSLQALALQAKKNA